MNPCCEADHARSWRVDFHANSSNLSSALKKPRANLQWSISVINHAKLDLAHSN
jgi:hypothetical protein